MDRVSEILYLYEDEVESFADGGTPQLVQPSVDGSRPGYQGKDKYITPARRSGAEGFQGQKFYDVKDPTYSDGRRRVKTKEYKAWLEKEIAKAKKQPDYASKGFIRREPGLLRIAEAMQQADITDNFEHLMVNSKDQKKFEKYHKRKMKTYKKGMLQAGDMVYINNLEKNFDDVIFIADQLGESTDWVLDKLDERNEFRDFAKTEKDIMKKDSKYTKPRNDYLKVENWVQKNAKKYSTPESFEKALRKRFGNKNQFIVDMGSNKTLTKTYFSDGFKKTMLNADPGSGVKPHHLKQFIKSSLYNFNPKIKAKVTEELKGIFNAENLPKLRTEARKMIRNNPTLKMFGMDKGITGPFPKVIQAEIGKDLWIDLKNFRHPRVGTAEMLRAFSDLVPSEFKPMFQETIKAINYSKNNQWQKAKDTFGIADNIAWDHKVPSSVIDKGYADIIEYTKVNPTTEHFNERIKNAQFDSKINKLITKYEGVNTLDQKVGIVKEMNKVKSNFNEKYGNYLGEIDIKLDEKGNLRFSSSAKPLTTKMDRIKMLQTSLQQEQFSKMSDKDQIKFLQEMGYGKHCKATGGRVGFRDAGAVGVGQMKCIMSDVEKTRADLKSQDVTVRAKALTKQRKALQVASKLPQIGKIVRQGLQAGAAGLSTAFKWTGLGSPIGYAIEGAIEGGVYDFYRRQGYNHNQAFAETFTPRLAKEAAEGKSTEDVPWYGGAEKLVEKEKIGTRWDPSGKVNLAAKYADAKSKYDAALDKYNFINASMTTYANVEDWEKDLNAQAKIIADLESSVKPGTPEYEAYQQAEEKQTALMDKRARDYKSKNRFLNWEWDLSPAQIKQQTPSDFKEKQKLKERYRDMDEYKTTSWGDPMEAYSLKPGEYFDWDSVGFGGEEGVKDKWKQIYEIGGMDLLDKIGIAGGVSKMAGGGIASIRRPGAIPPESGPTPYGLPSMLNRVKKV